MTQPSADGVGPPTRLTRRARITALASTVVAIAAFAGFVVMRPALTGTHLTSPATDAFGISLPSTNAGQPYTFGGLPVCLDKPGTAEIDEITLVAAKGGIEVKAFAARPLSHELFGEEPKTLAGTGFGGSRSVSTTCDSTVGGDELAVELVKSEASNARFDAIAVAWHSDAASGEVTIPFHLVLCQGADANVPECRSLP